jgi:hypothetical protein
MLDYHTGSDVRVVVHRLSSDRIESGFTRHSLHHLWQGSHTELLLHGHWLTLHGHHLLLDHHDGCDLLHHNRLLLHLHGLHLHLACLGCHHHLLLCHIHLCSRFLELVTFGLL